MIVYIVLFLTLTYAIYVLYKSFRKKNISKTFRKKNISKTEDKIDCMCSVYRIKFHDKSRKKGYLACRDCGKEK